MSLSALFLKTQSFLESEELSECVDLRMDFGSNSIILQPMKMEPVDYEDDEAENDQARFDECVGVVDEMTAVDVDEAFADDLEDFTDDNSGPDQFCESVPLPLSPLDDGDIEDVAEEDVEPFEGDVVDADDVNEDDCGVLEGFCDEADDAMDTAEPFAEESDPHATPRFIEGSDPDTSERFVDDPGLETHDFDETEAVVGVDPVVVCDVDEAEPEPVALAAVDVDDDAAEENNEASASSDDEVENVDDNVVVPVGLPFPARFIKPESPLTPTENLPREVLSTCSTNIDIPPQCSSNSKEPPLLVPRSPLGPAPCSPLQTPFPPLHAPYSSAQNSYRVFDLSKQFFLEDDEGAEEEGDDDWRQVEAVYERRGANDVHHDVKVLERDKGYIDWEALLDRARSAPRLRPVAVKKKPLVDWRRHSSSESSYASSLTCRSCGQSFESLDNLRSHNSRHADEKVFMCTTCSYTCKQSFRFKKHLLTHTEVKPYKCSYCPYTCREAGRLKIHSSTHTGLKPFKCASCSYSSATRGDLKKHILTHTGEKPFKCTTCSYSCRESGRLKKHVLTHTGEKPYKCHLCSYCCTTCGDLKKHLMTHTGEKPFKCPFCQYSCRESGRLKKHVLTHNAANRII